MSKFIYGVRREGAQIGVIESDERLTHAVLTFRTTKKDEATGQMIDCPIYMDMNIGEAKSLDEAEKLADEARAADTKAHVEIIRLSGVSL